jgi:hypothetical protein
MIIKMMTGLKDIDWEILKYIDDKELLKVCAINKKFWYETCDDNFIRRRLMKYPEIEEYKNKDESWKQFFLTVIYYVSMMKKNCSIEYKKGNFKDQYHTRKLYARISNEKIIVKDKSLKYCGQEGYLEVIKRLSEDGADVHANFESALRYASENGHIDIVKYLVELGSNIHAKNDFPLQSASEWGHLEVVKYLIESGVDIHSYEDYALRWASENGHLKLVIWLIENGADIHAKNDYALRWAEINENYEVVRYLSGYLSK